MCITSFSVLNVYSISVSVCFVYVYVGRDQKLMSHVFLCGVFTLLCLHSYLFGTPRHFPCT